MSLPMSQVSTVIMGPTGLFMYESSNSIFRTSNFAGHDSESFCVSELLIKIGELDLGIEPLLCAIVRSQPLVH